MLFVVAKSEKDSTWTIYPFENFEELPVNLILDKIFASRKRALQRIKDLISNITGEKK